MDFYAHPSAEVSTEATIGQGTRIWHQAQIREGVRIGDNCIIGKGVYIDFDVTIGHCCKIQNSVNVYYGVTIEDGVLLGPGAMLLNDKNPRAINPEGKLKSDADWEVSSVHIKYGAGIGGGALILPGVTIGQWAIIGSGAVVTRDIPDYGLAYGSPARLVGFVCPCGQRLEINQQQNDSVQMVCPTCQRLTTIPLTTYDQIHA